MNKKNLVYLEMELLEARLGHGRFNTDFSSANQESAQRSLFANFRKLAKGGDFNLPAMAGLAATEDQVN